MTAARHALLDRTSSAAVSDALRRLADMLDALSPQQRALVQGIMRRPGISTPQLADLLWSHDPDGGPDDAPRLIITQVSKARARMAPHGYTLRSAGWRWYVERIAA